MQSWKFYTWLFSHSTDQQLTKSISNVSPLSFGGTCTTMRFQNVCPVGFRNVLHFRNCCVSFILPPFHWEWSLQLHSSCSITVYSMQSALQGAEVRAHQSLPRTDPARSNPCCWVNIWTSKQNFRSDLLKLFFFKLFSRFHQYKKRERERMRAWKWVSLCYFASHQVRQIIRSK